MSRFEYLSVLISIIIALGLSEVVVCWVRLLRHRDTVQFYWIHSLWTLLAVLLIVQLWWGFWQYQAVEDWTFAGLTLLVAESIVLVVVALLLTPSREDPVPTSLRGYYFAQSRLLFGLAAALIVMLMVVDVVVGHQPLLHPENVIRPVAAVLLASLAWASSPRWHGSVAVISLGLLLTFTAVMYVNDGL